MAAVAAVAAAAAADTRPESKPLVGGIVTAPTAVLAAKAHTLQTKTRVSPSSAQLVLDGATPVPDGTRVELARIDESGNVIDVIASTITSGGRYHFDFEKLGVEFSRDLIVRAVYENGPQELRASVVYGVVDIDPITEATFRLMFDRETITNEYDRLLERLLEDINPEYPLGLENVSTYDLTKVAAAVRLFAIVTNFSVLSDIESTARGFLRHLSSQRDIVGLIDSVFNCCGTWGPGDIGNYFPMERETTWTYDVTVVKENEAHVRYEREVTIPRREAEPYGCDTVFESRSPLESGTRKRYFGKIRTYEGPPSVLTECEYVEQGRSAISYPAAYFPPIVAKARIRGDDDGDDVIDSCV